MSSGAVTTIKTRSRAAPPDAEKILEQVRHAEALERDGEYREAAEAYRAICRDVRKRQTLAGSSPVSKIEMENRHARCAQAIPAPPEIDWHSEVNE